MALAPTAATIGAWAGVVLLTSRLVQGFSAGGEFGSATTFLVETAPNRKAYYASWQVASQGISMFLASAFGYVLSPSCRSRTSTPGAGGSRSSSAASSARSASTSGPTDGDQGVPPRAPDEAPIWRPSASTGPLLTGGVVGVATISVYLILFMPTYRREEPGPPA